MTKSLIPALTMAAMGAAFAVLPTQDQKQPKLHEQHESSCKACGCCFYYGPLRISRQTREVKNEYQKPLGNTSGSFAGGVTLS